VDPNTGTLVIQTSWNAIWANGALLEFDSSDGVNAISANFWTGTQTDGSLGANCNNWTSTNVGDTGIEGDDDASVPSGDPFEWIENTTRTCDLPDKVACLVWK